MDTLLIVLCGTDAFRVEGALQGSVANTHFAWNRSYTISCTPALGVEQLDRRALQLSHAIVLCKGGRAARASDAYGNKPVIALDDAPDSCTDGITDAEFYYGRCTLEELRDRLVSLALAPPHVLYDSLLGCLTPVGERAFQRAFWLMDKDGDGRLLNEEVVWWRRLTDCAQVSEADVAAFLTNAYDTIQRGRVAEMTGEETGAAAAAAEGKSSAENHAAESLVMDVNVFLELHARWLAEEQTLEAWATLHTAGTHPDGEPYTWHDLHSQRVDPSTNTYLSAIAIQFFIGVHKRGRMQEALDMWSLTPGCPWGDIDGFAQQGIPIDRFIEYWKYMATQRHESVIMFARHWGFRGDATLLFARRHTRFTRTPEEPLPNMLHVLVVGAANCGKSQLAFTLTTTDDSEVLQRHNRNEAYVRTMSGYFDKDSRDVRDSGRATSLEPLSIAYTCVTPTRAEYIMTNRNSNRTVDIVMLCYDGGNAAWSGRHIIEFVTKMKSEGFYDRIPSFLVMTKSDTVEEVGVDEKASDMLMRFCMRKRLLWPPVLTSSVKVEETDTIALNEYVHAVAFDPSLAIGNPPLTIIRKLRRATFAAIVVVVVAGLTQSLITYTQKRRE